MDDMTILRRAYERENVCPECGADFQIHTIPERGMIAVGCLNKELHGY